MHVRGFRILDDVLGLLLDLLDRGLLDDNRFGEVLEELVELDEGALDVLDIVVAGANGA